jgi:phosphoadenosine phosphosulfate reductase
MSLDTKIGTAISLLQDIQRRYAPAAFANSLGAEDMVLTDLLARHAPGIGIFTLDTGRLPVETYELVEKVREYYGISLTVYYPNAQALERYVNANGINAFYRSIELRRACCHLRKVEPLKRALSGKRAWITGLRRDQAATRGGLAASSFDADNGLWKFNPLIDWSHLDVWTYIRERGVPYNALHDRGYPSVGCAPCTRAITAGEDVRAGRWWWEAPESKECGLHVPGEIFAGQKP